jgi:hypothetical protein
MEAPRTKQSDDLAPVVRAFSPSNAQLDGAARPHSGQMDAPMVSYRQCAHWLGLGCRRRNLNPQKARTHGGIASA